MELVENEGGDTLPSDLPRWLAPAKLNLFLHITGQREDGYHNLQTVFQILDVGDELAFRPREDGVVRRVSDVPGVPEESDLVVRAARLLQPFAASGAGVDIYIHKILPMGGGLGGGSSDAATTLRVLNELWGCGLSVARLAALGAGLGADVPVFVLGKTAWAEGIGEELTPLSGPEICYLVLKPDVEISTAKLFSSTRLTRDCEPIKIPSLRNTGRENVFEPVVREMYPEVDSALRWLSQYAPARLTGTGSCIFAPFGSEEEAQQVLKGMPDGMEGFVARGVNESLLLSQLATQLVRSER